MGLPIREIVSKKTISMDDLAGKVLAIDSHNMLYQFLTTIRARDGTALMDSGGNVTSHLVGLFARTTNFMQRGLRLAFVFDGTAPALKGEERKRRAELKAEAQAAYDKAVSEEDTDAMKRYAGRVSKLTPAMVAEAKELICALGLPVVQAPSEGEAQAAHMVQRGDAYATVSQDFDALLFGTPRLVRNLSIAGKRKRANKLAYETVKPELAELAEVLNTLGMDLKQFTALAMLVGTDYNVGGIKGIGPKNAIKLVKEERDLDALFERVKWGEFFSVSWKEVYDTIRGMPVTDEYRLEWTSPDKGRVGALLEQHDFSKERIESALKKLKAGSREQKGLGEFF
ncbi:MAG: flap endonuclease-1 [archaeon]